MWGGRRGEGGKEGGERSCENVPQSLTALPWALKNMRTSVIEHIVPLLLSFHQLENTQRVEAHLNKARLYTEKHDHRAAQFYLDRCLDAAPKCIVFKTMKAEALALLKKFDDAHALCK